MMFDTFCRWFNGCWNNQRQAYSDPKGQALVHVIHELVEDDFICSYRYRRQKNPYRYFEAKVLHNDGHILLKNPIHDIVFKLQTGAFVTNSEFTRNGVRYINEAYLGPNHYHVKDQGFDLKSGKQLWGLEGNSFYEFDRT